MKKFFLLAGVVVILGGVTFVVIKKVKSPDVQSAISTQNSDVAQPKDVAASSTIIAPAPEVVDLFPNDKDRDGFDDRKEAELGLSDKTSDTDKDGLDDSDEIETYKTDPKKFDTDGDTYGDGYEVMKGYDPKGPGKLPEQTPEPPSLEE